MQTVKHAIVRPSRSLNLLSQREIAGLLRSEDNVFELFRQCALAVLNTGNEQDNAAQILDTHADFSITIIPESRGIKLEVRNAPASAFVGNRMIQGIQDHLFAVLRDIIYTHHKMSSGNRLDFSSGEGITDAVFRILRNASIVRPNLSPNLVVCWGGHSIQREEYDFTKLVGYELGLRHLDIATGCGMGAMKGPMKGAVIAHGKQQVRNGRYVGISEPGIIASESPNPTVNELVILPDIEKRLETFVRLAHCIVVFPGGAGTAEEILYLLGVLMHGENAGSPLPVIFAASESQADYFIAMDDFIRATLGENATRYYQVIIGSAEKVAQAAYKGIERVQRHRRKFQESYAFNWNLRIPYELQQPFEPTHENMAALKLHRQQSTSDLAHALRCVFSGIVAGNVKARGIQAVNEKGPFELHASTELLQQLDRLLSSFAGQGRMKLIGEYLPCYRIRSQSKS